MRMYGKDEFIKTLKHLATYFDVYNCVSRRGMNQDALKAYLMKHLNKPESTARSYIKAVKEDESSLLMYDEEIKEISIDQLAVDEFFYNAEILLRKRRPDMEAEDKVIKAWKSGKGGGSDG